MIGVGVIGLLAYGYMLIFSNISPEYIKYSVAACAFAVLFPFAITIRKMTTDFSSATFWTIVIVVAAIFSYKAYSMMEVTEKGIIFDLFEVVSSEKFRWSYLALLVTSTILPFIWEKAAPYILAITMGVIVPVAMYTFILVLVLLIVCSIISSYGKSSNNSSRLSSIFTSLTSSPKSTQLNVQKNDMPNNTHVRNNNRLNNVTKNQNKNDGNSDYLSSGWTVGTASFRGNPPSSCISRGDVTIWYNGQLTEKAIIGDVEYWEGTGDICVLYPKNYHGKKLEFYSRNGTVQIQSR